VPATSTLAPAAAAWRAVAGLMPPSTCNTTAQHTHVTLPSRKCFRQVAYVLPKYMHSHVQCMYNCMLSSRQDAFRPDDPLVFAPR
jgi:hypothetical protein